MITKENINKLAATFSKMAKTMNDAAALANDAAVLYNDAAKKLGELQEEVPALFYEKEKLLSEIEALRAEKAQLIGSLQKTIDGLRHAAHDEIGLNTDSKQETTPKHPVPVKKESPNTVKKPAQKPSKATTAIVDQFKAQTSINDSRAKPEPTITVRQPIRDIAKAIAINDRFLFIRELFEGDTSLFSQTVNKLNAMHNLEEAKQYMQTVAKNWDDTTEPAQLFLSIVQRRYL
jgi:hypothetical protein